MDPDAAIAEFWLHYREAESYPDGSGQREAALDVAANRAADLFGWLQRGGFPPVKFTEV